MASPIPAGALCRERCRSQKCFPAIQRPSVMRIEEAGERHRVSENM